MQFLSLKIILTSGVTVMTGKIRGSGLREIKAGLARRFRVNDRFLESGMGIRGAVGDAVAAGLMDIRKEIDINTMGPRQDLFFEFHVSCYSRPWPLEPMCWRAAVPGDRIIQRLRRLRWKCRCRSVDTGVER
jgi:hypothetical protein